GPISVGIEHLQAEVGHEVDPVDPALEEGATARHARVIAPVAGALTLERVHRDEPHLAHRTVADQFPELAEQWLVEVVLGHEHPTTGRGSAGGYVVEIARSEVGWLFDDDVLPGG